MNQVLLVFSSGERAHRPKFSAPLVHNIPFKANAHKGFSGSSPSFPWSAQILLPLFIFSKNLACVHRGETCGVDFSMFVLSMAPLPFFYCRLPSVCSGIALLLFPGVSRRKSRLLVCDLLFLQVHVSQCSYVSSWGLGFPFSFL